MVKQRGISLTSNLITKEAAKTWGPSRGVSTNWDQTREKLIKIFDKNNHFKVRGKVALKNTQNSESNKVCFCKKELHQRKIKEWDF